MRLQHVVQYVCQHWAVTHLHHGATQHDFHHLGKSGQGKLQLEKISEN